MPLCVRGNAPGHGGRSEVVMGQKGLSCACESVGRIYTVALSLSISTLLAAQNTDTYSKALLNAFGRGADLINPEVNKVAP